MTDLSFGHLAADFAQGALPAILVFLKPVLHLVLHDDRGRGARRDH